MGTTDDTDSFIELLESSQSQASDELEVLIAVKDDHELEEASPESVNSAWSKEETSSVMGSFDSVDLPVGLAVSTPSGSEGSLQRLWEGGLFEMGDHADVTLQTACCPWRTFGRNMERSGFGTSWRQGGVFLLLLIGALSFYVVFTCTGSPWYIYGSLGSIFLVALYAGHYRARMRRRFNIVGSEADDTVSSIDDHLYHLMCGCCSLCQEARTLKSNNVHNGVWHGRGDILVIGSQVVFSPGGAGDLGLMGQRRLPSWRKLTSKVEKPLVVALESEPEHSWSPLSSQQQSFPLLKL